MSQNADAEFAEWWATVEAHLEPAVIKAIAMMPSGGLDKARKVRMREKAHRGWIEHGGDIRFMAPHEMYQEAQEEVDDQIIYLAAAMARAMMFNDRSKRAPL